MQFLQSLIMDKSNNPRILERCFSVKDSIQFRVSVRQRFYSDRSISRPRGEGGGGGKGESPRKIGWPASQNHYPIFDQNLRYSLPDTNNAKPYL